MTPNFKVEAVLFDMDGLMLDTERLSQSTWRRAMGDWGYDLSDEVYLTVVGRTAISTWQVFREAFGQDLPLEEIFARRQVYHDEITKRDGIALQPGVRELLHWLDTTPWKRAVASSTRRPIVLKRLEIAGVLDRFTTIAGGDEVEHGKPAPDIFLLAAERLGVAPEHCVVLEDSDAGIQAAHKAGMLPLMVPDMKPPSETSLQLAGGVFASLYEVKTFLETLGQVPAEGIA
jgi:HAD superfamily hydrolase (TIGR01509 family)